jgi:hypothetical protein
MKQKRSDSWKNKAISRVNVNVISAKTKPASTANNVSCLFAINASLNTILGAKKFFYFKNLKFYVF